VEPLQAANHKDLYKEINMTALDVNPFLKNIGKALPSPKGEKQLINGVLITAEGGFYEIAEDYGHGPETYVTRRVDKVLEFNQAH